MWIHLIVTVLLLVCKGQSRYENEKLEGVCGNCTCGYISKPFSKDPYFVKLIQSRGGLQNQSIDCVNKSLFAYPKFLTDNQSFIHVDLSHNPLYRSKDHENDWSEKWMICRVFPKLLSISLASTGLKKLGSIFKGKLLRSRSSLLRQWHLNIFFLAINSRMKFCWHLKGFKVKQSVKKSQAIILKLWIHQIYL